ncbi:hypothetical protein [Kitasatospora sp. NPDC050543]
MSTVPEQHNVVTMVCENCGRTCDWKPVPGPQMLLALLRPAP